MLLKMLRFLLFLTLIYHSRCEEKNPPDDSSSIECEDQVVITDDNGTTDYHSVVTQKIKFYLLTPSNETIQLNSSNLNLVNTSQPTKLLIHGLGTYDEMTWVDQLAAVYHTKGNYNVISVDWSKISAKDETFLVSVVDSVGNVVGNFIMDIFETSNETMSDVHLIGSSVGAHVGGAAGETIARNGTKVGRITGLDPSKPQNLEILDASDAEFVDVIHTSVVKGESECGTVDFYVMGNDLETPVCHNDTCGELLADDLFIRSTIDGARYEGITCYNTSAHLRELCAKAHGVYMGENVSKNISGSYLVAKDAAAGIHGQGKFSILVTALIMWYILYV